MNAATSGSPAPRTPRNRTAPPANPGELSGSIPVSVRMQPISLDLAAHVVSTGQPVDTAHQPAPSASQSAHPARKEEMPFWVRLALGVAAGIVGIALLFLLSTFLNKGAPTTGAASGQPDAVQAAQAAEIKRLQEELARNPGGPRSEGSKAEARIDNHYHFHGVAPVAGIPPASSPNAGKGGQPTAPAAKPAASAQATPVAGIPPHGCMYTSDGTAILKGQTTTLAPGVVIAKSTFADINASKDKAIVEILNQFPNWKTDLPQRLQMCAKWSAHKAEQLQEPKGRALGNTTLIK